MNLKKLILIVLVLLAVLIALLIFSNSLNLNNDNNTSNINENNQNNQNNSNNGIKTINIGSNNKGKVELIGPIGKKNSNVKIAYIVGVHPLEKTVHNALYQSLIAKSNSLNHCYYIYKITVTENPDNFDIGRMNGQLIAKEFVVPDVTSKSYDLVVDIHSNQGTEGGSYKETNFIFAPLNDASSKAIAEEIIAKIPPLVYYFPEAQTSPSYVTNPIVRSGTPTIIYETYMFEPSETTKNYIEKLIKTIDNLKF